MNIPQKPAVRPTTASAPVSSTRPTPPSGDALERPRPRRRAGIGGTNALITVASLLAAAGGWAWIARTEQPAAEPPESAPAVAYAPAEADPLVLAPIPTLAPQIHVSVPMAAASNAAVQPTLREVDPASAVTLVPTAAPQVQTASRSQSAVVQPAPNAPAQSAPAPVTRTRSSRRRTR